MAEGFIRHRLFLQLVLLLKRKIVAKFLLKRAICGLRAKRIQRILGGNYGKNFG